MRHVILLVVLTLTCSPQAQTVWENPVKKQLREGKPVIAGTVTVPSLLWIEM